MLDRSGSDSNTVSIAVIRFYTSACGDTIADILFTHGQRTQIIWDGYSKKIWRNNMTRNTVIIDERVSKRGDLEMACTCGFRSKEKDFKFCPRCGKQLEPLEADGTYKAERYPCLVRTEDRIMDRVFYYKVDRANEDKVYVYISPETQVYMFYCDLSAIIPLQDVIIQNSEQSEN